MCALCFCECNLLSLNAVELHTGQLELRRYKMHQDLSNWFFQSFVDNQYTVLNIYSKVSIIRPGPSRLLEFEKKIVLVIFNRDFFQISRPGDLIETKCNEIKHYDQIFLKWTWSFNRDFLDKFRPGHLIKQDA